ncbi:uncharacterized protein LOC143021768 isoform X1 [Oratosquilla oratoria]|uniref:uncharacterized protein LOC143021768 isoform X1 n=1 Tax=Oratosquilla oratoria TaxID=337810 RepID=UPI003F75D611
MTTPKKISIKTLRKTKSKCKGWVTRASKALNNLLKLPTTTISQIEYAIQEYDKRVARLDEVQDALLTKLSDSERELALDEVQNFKIDRGRPRILAEDKIKELTAAEAARTVPTNSVSQESQAINGKLPKLELPKFDGEVTQWQSFWDQFSFLIDTADLPVISKYTYLLSSLEGDARNMVKGLANVGANYQVACDLLKEHYGKRERIICAHVQALLNCLINVNTSGCKCVLQLWKLCDEILTHSNSLEALGITVNPGEVFPPVIFPCLSNELQHEWPRDDGDKSNLDWLLKILYKEISRLESSDIFKGKKSSIEENENEDKVSKEKMYLAAALPASSKQENGVCCFCGRKHKSEKKIDELKLSRMAQGEKIRSLGLCLKCLCSGHMARECKANIRCTSCNGGHSVLMCGVRLEQSPRRNKIEGTEGATISEETQDSIGSLTESIALMDSGQLMEDLKALGVSPGPITSTTMVVYQRHLMRLRKNPTRNVSPEKPVSANYPRELQKTLQDIKYLDLDEVGSLEDEMKEPFLQPDKSRYWRDGTCKRCFNYLLLDPRITHEFTSRASMLSEEEKFELFISSIFYIGKGSQGRPYSHLYEAITTKEMANKKLEKIQEIWTSGFGVVSLHVFHNTIPVEAWTREAVMISAIGLQNLFNCVQGTFYGPASTWRNRARRLLGIYLLHKAMNILILEGETQIRPAEVCIPKWKNKGRKSRQ